MKQLLSLILILAISISVNAQKVLFLDAGHGGKDVGAISATGVTELELNTAFVKELKVAAEAKGIKVVLVSGSTEYVSLANRVRKVNEYKLQAGETAQFISIHANTSKNPAKSGQEVYVMRADERSEGSLELAEKLASVLGVKVQEKGLTVLREANIPAVMIEMGFISNQNDLNTMLTPDNRSILIDKIMKVLAE